ncbi:MAG: hypothetical protein MJ252_02255 [archaeon]|nr:hypothetical protein [archaeon]
MNNQGTFVDSQFDSLMALLPKLYNSIVHPNSNQMEALSPVNINTYKRILTSRWNISETQESQIINSILDSADKLFPSTSGQNMANIERLQSLYSRLTKKRFPTQRWACLYLLNRLSQDNNMAQFRTSNILNSMSNANQAPNSFDNNISNDLSALNYLKDKQNKARSQFDSENNQFIKRPSPIVVNENETSQLITEKELVNDLMFVLQGIDGHYISYVGGIKDMFTITTTIPFKEEIFDIVYQIGELGWLYKKVSSHLKFFNETNIPSQFIQSFSYAVQNELNEYYKLVSFFKKKLSKTDIPSLDGRKQNEDPSVVLSSEDDLTLKNLVLWTMEPLERMSWLAMACESVSNLRGSPVLSQIYSYVNFAGGDTYLKRVLDEISKPFLFFVRNWILHGDLQDPFKEFFVDVLDQINDDDIWTLKYQLVYKNIPNFLSKNLAVKIFEIGKCIHFIKTYCGESDYSLGKIKEVITEQINAYQRQKDEENKMDVIPEDRANVNTIENINIPDNDRNIPMIPQNNSDQPQNPQNIFKEQKETQYVDINSLLNCLDFLNSLDNFNTDTNYANQFANEGNEFINQTNHLIQNNASNFLSALLIQLDLLHSLVNKELLKIIYKKFNFKENLIALNKYLLLGQGDMMQSLMEGLFEELKKPANHIFKHNLQANLETAIRSTNAQYNDADCLKKLNIKLMDPSIGDTGWDIFLLEYNVDVPLTVIFNKDLLKKYQKLFFFFWKLKRIEFSQNHQVWRKFMEYSHSLKGNFDQMRRVIQRSMLFNQQVVHFVTNIHNFVALEVLETQFKKIIDVLPEVKTMDELIELHQKFLSNISEQSLLNSEDNAIYKKVLQIFDIILKFRVALDVLTSTFIEGHYERPEMSDSMNINKQYSTEASIQISSLFEEFKREVCELINSIEFLGKGNLKYLAMKLDYNYYYSLLEKEKENQQQMQEMEKINREEQIKREDEMRRRQQMNQDYGNYSQNIGDDEEGGNEEEDDFKEDPSGVGNEYEINEGNEEEEIDTRRRNESHGNDENMESEGNYDDDGDDINMNTHSANINSTSRVNTNRNNASRDNLDRSQRSNMMDNSRVSRNNDSRNDGDNY